MSAKEPPSNCGRNPAVDFNSNGWSATSAAALAMGEIFANRPTGIALGADKGCDGRIFVLRSGNKLRPYVAQYFMTAARPSTITGRATPVKRSVSTLRTMQDVGLRRNARSRGGIRLVRRRKPPGLSRRALPPTAGSSAAGGSSRLIWGRDHLGMRDPAMLTTHGLAKGAAKFSSARWALISISPAAARPWFSPGMAQMGDPVSGEDPAQWRRDWLQGEA